MTRRVAPAELAASEDRLPGLVGYAQAPRPQDRPEVGLRRATGRVARIFHVSEGRISQLRNELRKAWEAFVGDPPMSGAATTAVA